MAIAIVTSFQQQFLNTGPVSGTASINNGGNIQVFAAGTTTPLTLYSNDTLLTTTTNPVTLDSAGRHAMTYIAAGTKYKIVVRDSANNTVKTRDNIDPGIAANTTLSIAGGGTGATSAGAARTALDVPSNAELAAVALDLSNLTTEVNSLSLIAPPQGYLTVTSVTPVITGDVSAATSLYYTPDKGNSIPMWNGTAFSMEAFAELTLTMNANHLASNIYDVFVWDDAGTTRLVTGPAWNVASAGGGSRGTGAGTTELERVNGILVNKVSMTARNGGTTYSVSPRYATYVGSIFVDGTNGQLTCHRTWGASRKWAVWNAYNRRPIILKAGDSTASWTYGTGSFQPSRNQATNSLTIFSGLAEEMYLLSFEQDIASNSITSNTGIGFNSTTAASGKIGYFNGGSSRLGLRAQHIAPPSLGINVITALEFSSGGNTTFYGTETEMVLAAQWMA
jgi:hypothetical protein